MNKKIKVDKITGEILIQDGEYSFKQYGIAPDIIQVIVDLQRDKENLESQLDFIEDQYKYIRKLENMWDKLKEYVKYNRKVSLGLTNGYGVSLCDTILDCIKELEKGDSDE